MISGLFSCSEKAIETDLYGTRSDIRNGRHSGRQFRKIQAESKVKSRGRANSESMPSPPFMKQSPIGTLFFIVADMEHSVDFTIQTMYRIAGCFPEHLQGLNFRIKRRKWASGTEVRKHAGHETSVLNAEKDLLGRKSVCGHVSCQADIPLQAL